MDSEIWPVSTTYYLSAHLGQMHHPGFVRMIKERFQWQKGLTFESVWSPLSYKQIGMPVIGKRLQQNQCRKVLKPKKPRDLRGLKPSNVAGPKKEILLIFQGTKGNWKSRASNDLEHFSFVRKFVHFSSRLATTKSFCSTSLTESILSQSCSPKHQSWQWHFRPSNQSVAICSDHSKTHAAWPPHCTCIAHSLRLLYHSQTDQVPSTEPISPSWGSNVTRLAWFILRSETHTQYHTRLHIQPHWWKRACRAVLWQHFLPDRRA